MPMQPVNISDTGYQMFLDDESVFAPQLRGQERRAQQNALARQQSVRNALAQSINPKTGVTNYEFARQIGGVDLAPELQAAQQADILSQTELRGKRATALKAETNAAKTDFDLTLGHLQTMGGLIGAAVDEPTYQLNKRKAASMGYDVSELPEHFDAGYVANLRDRTLTAEQQLKQQNEQSMAEDRLAGRTETKRHNQAMEGIQSQQELRQGTPDPIKLRREATTLRKEFDALPEVKDFKAALPVLMSARNAPDTAAGDIDLAYAVGKIYDPKSVVRESEQKLVYTTGSVLQKLIGGANVALTGGTRLPSEVRQKLLNALNNRVLQFRQAYDQTRGTYEGYANQSGFDPVNVIGEHPTKAYKGQSSSVAQVKTDADYDKLPSGALFIDPNGEQRRKP